MNNVFIPIRLLALAPLLLVTIRAHAQSPGTGPVSHVGNTGASGIWILANISYAGMRAQGSRSKGWRIVAFIFGFPGTLVTWLAVDEGGERAYGVALPRK